MAFIDLGDQFIALQAGRKQPADDSRHVGLVVDDKEAARAALKAAGVKPIGGPFLDFRDPWGNRIEIVSYENIQFTKASNVLRGMGLEQLTKNESAKGAGGKRDGGELECLCTPYPMRPPYAREIEGDGFKLPVCRSGANNRQASSQFVQAHRA